MGAAAGGRLIPVAYRTVPAAARAVGRVGRRVGRGARGLALPAAAGAGGALAAQALTGGGGAGTVVISPAGGPVVATRQRRGGKPTDLVRLAQLDLVNNVVNNPMYAFLFSFVTIEILQSQKVVGNTAGSLAEVALGGIAYAKAISPLVERIGPAATELAGSDLITGNGGALGIPGVPVI